MSGDDVLRFTLAEKIILFFNHFLSLIVCCLPFSKRGNFKSSSANEPPSLSDREQLDRLLSSSDNNPDNDVEAWGSRADVVSLRSQFGKGRRGKAGRGFLKTTFKGKHSVIWGLFGGRGKKKNGDDSDSEDDVREEPVSGGLLFEEPPSAGLLNDDEIQRIAAASIHAPVFREEAIQRWAPTSAENQEWERQERLRLEEEARELQAEEAAGFGFDLASEGEEFVVGNEDDDEEQDGEEGKWGQFLAAPLSSTTSRRLSATSLNHPSSSSSPTLSNPASPKHHSFATFPSVIQSPQLSTSPRHLEPSYSRSPRLLSSPAPSSSSLKSPRLLNSQLEEDHDADAEGAEYAHPRVYSTRRSISGSRSSSSNATTTTAPTTTTSAGNEEADEVLKDVEERKEEHDDDVLHAILRSSNGVSEAGGSGGGGDKPKKRKKKKKTGGGAK